MLSELVENGGGDAAAIAAAKGFEAMDNSAVEAMVDEAIAADPDAWAKYCAGEEKGSRGDRWSCDESQQRQGRWQGCQCHHAITPRFVTTEALGVLFAYGF